MNVDELITALRLCSSSSEVVIETSPPDDTGKPGEEPIVGETAPVMFAGSSPSDPHTVTLLSTREITPPAPAEPAPLDPGQPGQLSPPEVATTAELDEPLPEEEYPQPLKSTKKK